MTDKIDPTSPLAKLNSEQLEIIRLVAGLKRSKEIAKLLNTTPHIVDNRLKEISRILGTQGRAEVAQLYQSAVQPAEIITNQSSASTNQPSEVHKHIGIGDEDASPGEQDRSDDRSASTLNQSKAPYVAGFHPWPERRSWISGLLEAGRPNELTPLVRTVCISITTLAAVCALAILIIVNEGMSRYF